MVRRTTVLAIVAIVGAGGVVRAQAPPDTDIWLATLSLEGEAAIVGAPTNLTDRVGYDNQPFFESATSLLYTSQRDGQTDIFRIDTRTGAQAPVTGTAESEYSPTPVPGAAEIAVVRVEADGRQRLWAFPAAGGSPRLVLPDVEPVGYHAWLEGGALILFVLGDPATLQLADGAAGTARVVADDIGRSLHPIPGQGRFSFLQAGEGGSRIAAIDPASGRIEDLGPILEGSQDMAWTPDGRMLMASGSDLYERRPAETTWRLVAQLGPQLAGITRLAVSPDGRALALVASAPSR